MTASSHQDWIIVYETHYRERARLLATLLQAGGMETELLNRSRDKKTSVRVAPTLVARARELLNSYSETMTRSG